MQKLEIAGDVRSLNESIVTLNELDCTIKLSKSHKIVPINVNDKEGFVLLGKHHLSTPQGPSAAVEISLLLGANGTLANLSEHLGPASDDTRCKVLNVLRRYSLHYLDGIVSSQSDVVLGLRRNGKGMDELLHVVGRN